MQSHMLAGLAGGGVVVLAGYGYYHFSGTKRVIDGVKSIKASAIQAKDRLAEKTPEPRVILQYLRSTAKAYAGFVPGASGYVDATFDSFDQLADSHNEEFESILKGAYDDLRPILKEGSLDQETAKRVFGVIRERTLQLQDLSARASSDLFGPLLDKHPEIKEKLGGTYDQVKKLASQSGPQVQQITKETVAKLSDTFKSGFDDKSVEKAKQILQESVERLQKATGEVGDEAKRAWQKSTEQAQPYLDKLPEIKELLESKASVLMSGEGAMQIWKRVKEIGEQKGIDKDKVKDLKNFINEKANDAGQRSGDVWDKIMDFSQNMPGAEKFQPQMEGIVAVVREDSQEAKELAKETFADIMHVLEEKAEKAKGLKEKAKEDGKEAKNKK